MEELMNRRFATLAILTTLAGCLQATPLAYLTFQNGQFGTVDLGTGAFTLISTGTQLDGLGTIGNTLYGQSSTGTLFQIDPLTGTRTTIGTAAHSFNVLGSTLNGLFAIDNSTDLYSINPA